MSNFLRYSFALLVVILVCLCSCSTREKIVDRSGKKPKWVKAETSNLIRVEVSASTLFAAKHKNKEEFKAFLSSTIARKLKAQSDSSKVERIKNYLSSYNWSKVKGESYNKITGFHDTLLLDSFWEKEKLSYGGYLFRFHGLYNCTNEEIFKIAEQFELMHNKIASRINKIENGIRENHSVQWYLNARDSIRTYLATSPPDYQESLQNLKQKIENQLSSTQLNITSKTRNKIGFEITVGGEVVQFTSPPAISSTCAKISKIEIIENTCYIEFDGKYCLSEDPQSGMLIDLGTSTYRLKRRILLF